MLVEHCHFYAQILARGVGKLSRNEIEKLTVKYDIKVDSQSRVYAANIEVVKPKRIDN